MIKFNPLSLLRRKVSLIRRIDLLESEVADLRARLIAAQAARGTAEQQAEELRSEKDRLRAKIASQKKAADADRRVTEQLRTKFEELQVEHKRLSARLQSKD